MRSQTKELRRLIWAEIKKEDGKTGVLVRWHEIINEWKTLVDFDNNHGVIFQTVAWHEAVNSTTNYEKSPHTDLPGEKSLIHFLEKVLEELRKRSTE